MKNAHVPKSLGDQLTTFRKTRHFQHLPRLQHPDSGSLGSASIHTASPMHRQSPQYAHARNQQPGSPYGTPHVDSFAYSASSRVVEPRVSNLQSSPYSSNVSSRVLSSQDAAERRRVSPPQPVAYLSPHTQRPMHSPRRASPPQPIEQPPKPIAIHTQHPHQQQWQQQPLRKGSAGQVEGARQPDLTSPIILRSRARSEDTNTHNGKPQINAAPSSSSRGTTHSNESIHDKRTVLMSTMPDPPAAIQPTQLPNNTFSISTPHQSVHHVSHHGLSRSRYAPASQAVPPEHTLSKMPKYGSWKQSKDFGYDSN